MSPCATPPSPPLPPPPPAAAVPPSPPAPPVALPEPAVAVAPSPPVPPVGVPAVPWPPVPRAGLISTVPKRQPPAVTFSAYEVVDLLSLLADKSLVVTDDSDGRTRYRLLETVRQYALEKLRESGDADAVRARHRDHYAAVAAGLDAPSVAGHERRLNQAELEGVLAT